MSVLGPLSWLPALGAGLLAVLGAPQKGDKIVRVPWCELELDAARTEARERNVPLLVFAVKEAEEENDRFREGLRHSTALSALGERAVLVVVNDGEHPLEVVSEKLADGSTRERRQCSLYGTLGCDPHQRNWDKVYLEYGSQGSSDGSWKLPEGIVLRPDGSIQERHNQGNPPSLDAILDSFETLAKEIGPGLGPQALVAAKEALAQGARHGEAKDWALAYAAFARTASLAPSGPYAVRAQQGLEAALAGMQARLGEIQALLVTETIEQGYPALVLFQKQCVGSPLEKETKALLARVEKDKAWKDVIQRLKVELEAEDLWQQHLALEQAGDAAKAKALLKKLTTPKYAGTEAGQRARAKSGG